jgi:Zn-dependent peptidase ImmA (M78 family)
MRRAEAEADRLLKEYRVDEPPVSVGDIACGEGAQIVRQRFEGSESGFILRDGKLAVIGINTLTSRRRQRFTIAHELGHMLLHDGRPLIVDHSIRVNFRNDVSSMATDDEEIEANAFAAALLMPRPLVLSHLKAYLSEIAPSGGSVSREDLIAQLAREFDVSAEAMGYRLINLGILAT